MPAGSRIQLIFYLFDLEYAYHGVKCRFDYVEVKIFIYNFSKFFIKFLQVFTGSSSQKYCGKKKPFLLTSSGNTMKIKFVSDGSVTDKGFYAKWYAIGGI